MLFKWFIGVVILYMSLPAWLKNKKTFKAIILYNMCNRMGRSRDITIYNNITTKQYEKVQLAFLIKKCKYALTVKVKH